MTVRASSAHGTRKKKRHRLLRPLWWKGYRPRVRPRCGSPKVPSGCNSCKRRRTDTVQRTRLDGRGVAPADIPKQWQEARANRRMQFKVGNYRDGSWESNIRLLTGTIKVDWIQLPVEQYLAALPTLKQGVIAGVFRQKGAAPWGLPTRRSCNSQSFSPMNCLWRTGMQGSMAYQLFGRRSL